MKSEERWKSTRILIRHFLISHLSRVDIWLLASATMLLFSIFSLNTIKTIHKDMFIISSGLYSMPIFVSTCLLSIFLTFLSMTKIAKDFDSRIYETYLYGPVDDVCYLLSIVITYTIINVIMTLILPIFWLLALYMFTGIPVTGKAVIELILGMVVVETIFLLGLVLVIKREKERNSIWSILIVQLLLIAIIFAHTVVSKYLVPIKLTDVDIFRFFRDVFSFLFSLSRFISPYTFMFLIQSIDRNRTTLTVLFLIIMLVVDIILFFLAKERLSRKLT